MKRKFFSVIMVFVLFGFMGTGTLFAQEVKEQAVEQSEKEVIQPQIKVWKVPPELLKNLTDMITEFNARFQETVEIYKAGLIATKAEFKTMPLDSILDIENGVFIDRLEYERLVAEAQAKQAQSQTPIKKEEKKK